MHGSLACRPALAYGPAPSLTTVVTAVGTARRLQALAYNAWSAGALGRRLAIPEHTIRRVQRGEAAQVPQALAEAVSAIYDQLWDKPGPSARAARAARRNGWVPPLAWDDDNDDGHGIDDPQAVPADWKPRRRLTAAQRGEEIAALMAAGCTPVEAAWRLGITRDALNQRLARARAQAGRSNQ
jgi:hypothetical protein